MTGTETLLDWDTEIAALLDELSSVQDELLAVLALKREQLIAGDLPGLAETQVREEQLAERLKHCQEQRADLLVAARKEGLAGGSLGSLASAVNGRGRGKLGERANAANTRMKLLRNECLTNWVLAQRALLHVSQLVEIIATGGRLQPTYGEGESVHSRGSLVNHEA
jgi:hypothetical protein